MNVRTFDRYTYEITYHATILDTHRAVGASDKNAMMLKMSVVIREGHCLLNNV